MRLRVGCSFLRRGVCRGGIRGIDRGLEAKRVLMCLL